MAEKPSLVLRDTSLNKHGKAIESAVMQLADCPRLKKFLYFGALGAARTLMNAGLDGRGNTWSRFIYRPRHCCVSEGLKQN